MREAYTEVSKRVHCEARVAVGCHLLGEHFHHILPRSRGGEDAAENGLLVCAPCHAWIHANPSEAKRAGWLQ